jgi:hypothetical protein
VVDVVQQTSLGGDAWERIYSESDRTLTRGSTLRPALPPAPASVTLTFRTPLRIKHGGRFVGPAHLTAQDLCRTLASRIAVLFEQYGPGERFDWAGLHDAMRVVELSAANLRWHELTRYSSRQQTEMQMGGLLGELTLQGPGLAALWPLIWLGQWTHVGKGTSFGLGWYRAT